MAIKKNKHPASSNNRPKFSFGSFGLIFEIIGVVGAIFILFQLFRLIIYFFLILTNQLPAVLRPEHKPLENFMYLAKVVNPESKKQYGEIVIIETLAGHQPLVMSSYQTKDHTWQPSHCLINNLESCPIKIEDVQTLTTADPEFTTLATLTTDLSQKKTLIDKHHQNSRAAVAVKYNQQGQIMLIVEWKNAIGWNYWGYQFTYFYQVENGQPKIIDKYLQTTVYGAYL